MTSIRSCPSCHGSNPIDRTVCAHCGAPTGEPPGDPAPVPSVLAPGHLLAGKYRIERVVGRGGMGVVYEAVDTFLGRKVAVKTIRFDTDVFDMDREERARRFAHEARAAGRLMHPHIVVVLDAGEVDGTSYMVMELVDGVPLATLLRRSGCLAPVRAITICRQVAEALAEAHRHGVIHRDVKPQNVLVTAGDRVKVMDFGIAKVLSEAATTTGESGLVGTPAYLSPERIWGGSLDARSDLFSLGSVFYECLAGRPPFAGPSVHALMLRIAEDPPSPVPATVTRGRERLERAYEAFFARALAKDPDSRFPDGRAFAAALDDLLSLESSDEPIRTPVAAIPASPAPVVVANTSTLPGSLVVAPADRTRPLEGPPPEPPPDVRRSRRSGLVTAALLIAAALFAGRQLVESPPDGPVPSEPPLTGDSAGPCPSGMAFVPAGSFLLGSTASEGDRDERPQRLVFLDAFCIDRTEVTVASYHRCVAAGRCEVPGSWAACNWAAPGVDDHPINCVGWQQAAAYCHWRGARLPTEAEWEKAARGDDGRTFPWGADPPDCDRAHLGDCGDRSAPVCSKSAEVASPYGLCDTAGNVWEWVADWYAPDAYANLEPENPMGPASGEHRVLRGGSWGFEAGSARVARRSWGDPAFATEFFGFRCAARP